MTPYVQALGDSRKEKKLNFNRNLQQARLRDGQPSVVMSWR